MGVVIVGGWEELGDIYILWDGGTQAVDVISGILGMANTQCIRHSWHGEYSYISEAFPPISHHPITLIPALNSILRAFPSSLLLIKLFIGLCATRHHFASFSFTLF